MPLVRCLAVAAALTLAAVQSSGVVQAQAGNARDLVNAAAKALGGADRIAAVRNITLYGYGQYAYQFGGGRITGEPDASKFSPRPCEVVPPIS